MGYEADGETGLNFAQARYQSSIQGRFTSVDPLGGSAGITDPQSFNRYSYVNNNPITFIDPTGMMLSDMGVVQTDDPFEARQLEHQSDRDFQMLINAQYTLERGGSVSYEGNHASFLPDNSGLNVGEVPFNGYFDPEGVLTWWYGMRYSIAAETALTSFELVEPPSPDPADYRSLDISVGEGYQLGASFKQDSIGRCYFGIHGGAGLSLNILPVSGSATEGHVFHGNRRASDPDTVKTALTGVSNALQVALPTTDVVGLSGNADLVTGAVPNGVTATERGNGLEIPTAAGYREYAFKVPRWLMFPVNRITRCK